MVMAALLGMAFSSLGGVAQADFTATISDSASNPYAWVYVPRAIEVTTGDTVTWVNTGVAPHSVTGANFDSGNLDPGQRFQWTFNQAGTYAIYCSLHPWMVESVVVSDNAASAPSE